MTTIIKTRIDENGNLALASKEKVKTLSIIRLNEDPVRWSAILTKDTGMDKDFVEAFLRDNGLSYSNIAKLAKWFPFYYTTFLMEIANAVKELGISEVKQKIAEDLDDSGLHIKGLEQIISSIPDNIDKNTKVGVLSDCFNKLTSIDSMLAVLD